MSSDASSFLVLTRIPSSDSQAPLANSQISFSDHNKKLRHELCEAEGITVSYGDERNALEQGAPKIDPNKLVSRTSSQIKDQSTMNDGYTRTEMDAKLDSVRADLRASLAEASKETTSSISQINVQIASMQGQMLAEMQGLRADFATMLKDVAKEMADAKVAAAGTGEKVAGLQGSIAEVRGSIDGLKSSISMFQWIIGVVVAIAAIGVGWLQYDLAKQSPPAQQSATLIPSSQAEQPAATALPKK